MLTPLYVTLLYNLISLLLLRKPHRCILVRATHSATYLPSCTLLRLLLLLNYYLPYALAEYDALDVSVRRGVRGYIKMLALQNVEVKDKNRWGSSMRDIIFNCWSISCVVVPSIFNVVTQKGICRRAYRAYACACIFGAGGSVGVHLQHCEPNSRCKNLEKMHLQCGMNMMKISSIAKSTYKFKKST